MADIWTAFEARMAATQAQYEARLAEISALYEAQKAALAARKGAPLQELLSMLDEMSAQAKQEIGSSSLLPSPTSTPPIHAEEADTVISKVVVADPLLPEDDSLPDLNRAGPIAMPKKVMEAVEAESEVVDTDPTPAVDTVMVEADLSPSDEVESEVLKVEPETGNEVLESKETGNSDAVEISELVPIDKSLKSLAPQSVLKSGDAVGLRTKVIDISTSLVLTGHKIGVDDVLSRIRISQIETSKYSLRGMVDLAPPAKPPDDDVLQDVISWNNFISDLCLVGESVHGYWAIVLGIWSYVFVEAASVDMYVKLGLVDLAREVEEILDIKLVNRNTITIGELMRVQIAMEDSVNSDDIPLYKCKNIVASRMFSAARYSGLPELWNLRDMFHSTCEKIMEFYLNQNVAKDLKSKVHCSMEKEVWLMEQVATELGGQWNSQVFKQQVCGRNNSIIVIPRGVFVLTLYKDRLWECQLTQFGEGNILTGGDLYDIVNENSLTQHDVVSPPDAAVEFEGAAISLNRSKKPPDYSLKAMRVIAGHLSIKEIEVIREMFKLNDIDNDGKITYEEFKAGLRKVGSQLGELEIKMIIEVAESTLIWASVIYASIVLLMAMDPDGCHIVTNCYRKTQIFSETMLPKMGLTATFNDPVDNEGLESALKINKVSLYCVECSANPLFRCVDIKLVSELCHKQGALVCLDVTFANPLDQRALALCADLVIHSAIKFITVQNDGMADCIYDLEKLITIIQNLHHVLGAVLNPNAAYLFIRSLKTLQLCVQHQRLPIHIALIHFSFRGGMRKDEDLEANENVGPEILCCRRSANDKFCIQGVLQPNDWIWILCSASRCQWISPSQTGSITAYEYGNFTSQNLQLLMPKILVKGGTVANALHMEMADVYIEGGVIKCVKPNMVVGDHVTLLESTSIFVMPGGIDPHAHLAMNFMGTRTINDFLSLQVAALAGGTIMHMSFVRHINRNLLYGFEAHKEKRKIYCMDYGFHMAVTKWDEDVSKEMEVMVKENGINYIKLFLAYKGPRMVNDDFFLEDIDAEDQSFMFGYATDEIKFNKKLRMHASPTVVIARTGGSWFSRPRPPELKSNIRNLEDKVLRKGGAMLRNDIKRLRGAFSNWNNLSCIRFSVIG